MYELILNLNAILFYKKYIKIIKGKEARRNICTIRRFPTGLIIKHRYEHAHCRSESYLRLLVVEKGRRRSCKKRR